MTTNPPHTAKQNEKAEEKVDEEKAKRGGEEKLRGRHMRSG
jgi:hypothetical protein